MSFSILICGEFAPLINNKFDKELWVWFLYRSKPYIWSRTAGLAKSSMFISNLAFSRCLLSNYIINAAINTLFCGVIECCKNLKASLYDLFSISGKSDFASAIKFLVKPFISGKWTRLTGGESMLQSAWTISG